MSSRILSGGSAAAAHPIRWRRVIDPRDAGGAPCAEAGDGDPAAAAELPELRERIRKLETEVASRETQARQAGLREGEAAALEHLKQPLEEAARRLADRVEELAGLRAGLRRDAEQDVVRLAIAIARRILHRELATDPAALLGVVKAALDRLDAREVLRLRVHPDDVTMIREALAAGGFPEQVEIAGDAGLERGGLIVETSRGDLDASVESQLAEIERGFTDLVRRTRQ